MIPFFFPTLWTALVLALTAPATLTVQDQVIAEAVTAASAKYITVDRAVEHTLAARAGVTQIYGKFSLKTQDKMVRMLLGMAHLESRYDRDSVSRVFHGKRITGVIRGDKLPKGTVGPLFCGVVQTEAKYSWATCLKQRDLLVGYTTAAFEIAKWSRECARKGKRGDAILTCALSGFGGGWQSALKGSTYPTRVRGRVQIIEAYERRIMRGVI